MERTRRAILGSAVVLLGTGCLGRRSGGRSPADVTPTDTTTSPPPTDTTEPPEQSSLKRLSVHQSVRRRGTVHTDVRTGVFVVATFVDDGTVTRGNVALVLDGDRHEPVDWVVPAPSGDVAVAFEFPPNGVDAEAGRVEWEGGSTSLSERTLERLASPPSFVVREFSVPEEATAEADITVTITVKNTGGSDGRFLAEFGTLALSDQSEITIDVPVGERVTAMRSVSLVRQEGEETVVLGLGDERIERTVSVRSS